MCVLSRLGGDGRAPQRFVDGIGVSELELNLWKENSIFSLTRS